MKKIDLQIVKALSVAQPWAHCIISEGKNVENRNWNTKLRGFIAIHASAKYDIGRFRYCNEDHDINLRKEDVSFGAILGFAEIIDVITENEVNKETKDWFIGEYGFVLRNIIKLNEPITAKGSLGFWKVDKKTLSKCIIQLPLTKQKLILKNLLK
jgi:hypothetical protein